MDPALAAGRGGAYQRTGIHIRHGTGGRKRGRRVGGGPCHRPAGRTLAGRPLDMGAGAAGCGGDRAPGVDRAGPAAARPPRPHGGPDRAPGGRPGPARTVPRVGRLRSASRGPDALQFRPVPADGHVAGRLRPPRTGVSARNRLPRAAAHRAARLRAGRGRGRGGGAVVVSPLGMAAAPAHPVAPRAGGRRRGGAWHGRSARLRAVPRRVGGAPADVGARVADAAVERAADPG